MQPQLTDGTIAVLLAVVSLWGLFGLVMRLFQDLPMGYNTLPPGPEYEERSALIVERQRRFVQSWFRQWPMASIMLGVAVVLIVVK